MNITDPGCGYVNCIKIGYEVNTAVAVKSYMLWNITPCSSVNVNLRFRGTYRSPLQGRSPRKWWQFIPQNHRFTFTGLLGVTSQKMNC
jgi:hypothetical protein